MNLLNNNKNKENFKQVRSLHVIFLGFLGMLTIASVGMLHTNVKEFLVTINPSVSTFQISFYDTVLYLSYLIFGIITGIISDRLGKRKIFIVVGSAGSAIFSGLLTISPNYGVLLLLRFLQGTFTVLAWQTFMTLIMDLSSSKTRGRNMGIFGTFLGISMGMSPLVGGFLADTGVYMPYYIAIILNGIVFLISIPFLGEPEDLKKNPSIIRNLSVVPNNPKLIIPLTFNFIDRFHIGFILFALPLFILEVLDLDPSMRGIALAIFGLPFIILQYPFGKLSDKYGRYIPLILGSIGYGIILSFTGMIGSLKFTYLVIALFVLGSFSGITAPPNMALVADIVKTEDRAMGMSFFNLAGNLGIVLGPVIGGIILSNSNYIRTFMWMGILEFLVVIVGIVLLRFRFKKEKDIKVQIPAN